MLSPTVRRTFAPRGQTPIEYAWDRRDRISAISAITISPIRKRLSLVFELLPENETVHGEDVVAFLRKIHDHIPGPFTVVWDRSPIHRSRPVKTYLAKHPEIVIEQFPSYAPELNPDEGVWGHTKYARLANYAPLDVIDLHNRVAGELTTLKRQPHLLAAFIRYTKCSISQLRLRIQIVEPMQWQH